jgi:hypothetical protein
VGRLGYAHSTSLLPTDPGPSPCWSLCTAPRTTTAAAGDRTRPRHS